jgi:hypothetical protein
LVNLTDHRLDDQLVIFHGEAAGVNVKILLDSGASRNFASRDFVRRANIATSMGDRLRVRQANGQIIATDLRADLNIHIGDAKFEEQFVITDLGAGVDHPYDLILGKPWLTRHNPTVDWTTNTVQVHGTTLTGVVQHRPAAVTVLTATKMAKVLRKDGATMFIGTLTAVDPENAAAPEPPTLQESLAATDSGQTPEWTARLRELLHRHSITFTDPDTLPPERPGFDHVIELTPNAKPPPQRTYRMSPAELEEVKRQLDTYLAKGWVRPSSSPFGAPILFARKKDGGLRMCVDYRALNAITIRDRYPLPRIEELMDVMKGATIFTAMDLTQGYHQVRVKEEHVHRTV